MSKVETMSQPVTSVNVGQQAGFVSGQQLPGQPFVVMQSQPRPTNVPNYKHRQSIGLGATLVISGCLSIIFNIVDLCMYTGDNYYYYNSLGFVGHGFWSGIMCVIAGGFAIGAGRNRTPCQIRASIILCVIAACLCVGQLITAVIGAVIAGDSFNNRGRYCCTGTCSYYNYYGYQSSSGGEETVCQKMQTLIAMEALLAILSGVAGIAAIWASALGCRAACCCSCCCCTDLFPQTQQQFAVMPSGAQIMMITTPQHQPQQQQMFAVSYPAQQYPLAYPAPYPPGAYPAPPNYQFTAAPPYFPPPSTAVVAPQAATSDNPPLSGPPSAPIYDK